MARRFPRGVSVKYQRTVHCAVGPAGYAFDVRASDGSYLAGGWVEGDDKSAARDAAWHALEQIGLVVDE